MAIMEEREELMVSLEGGDPTTRNAHFLKPSITSVNGSVFHLPLDSIPQEKKNDSKFKKWPFKVGFPGWKYLHKKWKEWVDRMHSLHQSTWKKAGIYEAVLNSTYKIYRADDVIFAFAERWCPETKTFVLPWGEITITLEDMIILGGYSVMGDPVISIFLERELELKNVEQKLIEARQQISRSKAQKVCQYKWLNKFMNSGSEVEHEAFLALWLSRFVFTSSSSTTVAKKVLPIAIRLARGTKIALAPAVLASLYRDLSLLKQKIVDSNKLASTGDCEEDAFALKICAPLQMVQIWAWERFPSIRPMPNLMKKGEPRFTKWEKIKKVLIGNANLAIESASRTFLWRPYARVDKESLPFRFYCEKELFLLVVLGLDEEFESFARCLRVSELVGLDDNIEEYFPHRVAMQFGMDQDLPGLVPRANISPEAAWKNYTRPIEDEKLYFPSRFFQSNVTTRYLEWWNRSMVGYRNGIHGMTKRKAHGKENACKSSKRKVQESSEVANPTVSPGFPPKTSNGESDDKRNVPTRDGEFARGADDMQTQLLESSKVFMVDNDAIVPPGFPPKSSNGESDKPETET